MELTSVCFDQRIFIKIVSVLFYIFLVIFYSLGVKRLQLIVKFKSRLAEAVFFRKLGNNTYITVA